MHTVLESVVLRYNCKATPLLSLYTATHGRVIVRDMRRYEAKSPLHVGDIVSVHLDRFKKSWQLVHAQGEVTQPQNVIPETLFWRHHILDMYYCFIPLEQPSEELFSLLCLCARLDNAPPFVWKALLVRLFALLGYGVPSALFACQQLVRTIDEHAQTYNTANVLRITEQNKYSSDEKELDTWLVSMVQQHEHYYLLKTHYLLKQLYTLAGPKRQ